MLSWEALESACMGCERCALQRDPEQCRLRVGDPGAEVLFIWRRPGRTGRPQRRALVGRAGKLLDDMLAIIGLDRTKTYT
jgi:DNA polymerase